jgi:hypothetical protein
MLKAHAGFKRKLDAKSVQARNRFVMVDLGSVSLSRLLSQKMAVVIVSASVRTYVVDFFRVILDDMRE